MTHESQCFTISIRLRHAEVTVDVFFGVTTLLVTDEHKGGAIDGSNAADKRWIVKAAAISVEFDEFVGDVEGDVQEGGAVGVASDLEALDGRKAGIGVLAQLASALLQFLHLVGDVDTVVFGDFANLLWVWCGGANGEQQ